MASTSTFDSFASSLALALPTTPRKSPPASMLLAPGTPRACSVYSITPDTPQLESPSSTFTPSTASSRLFRVVQGSLSPLSPSPQCQRMVIDDFSAHRKSLARMSPTMAQKSKLAARPFAVNTTSHRRSTSSTFSSDWDSDDDLEEPVIRPSKGRASLPAFGKPAPGVCRKLFQSKSDSAVPTVASLKPRYSLPTHPSNDDSEDEEWQPLASARGHLQSKSTEYVGDMDGSQRGTKRQRL